MTERHPEIDLGVAVLLTARIQRRVEGVGIAVDKIQHRAQLKCLPERHHVVGGDVTGPLRRILLAMTISTPCVGFFGSREHAD